MTDHLEAARADLDRLEACNHGSWLASAVAHILDHLEAQQADPGFAAIEIDGAYGPLTFASRPADTPATAPQPDEAYRQEQP